MENPNHEKLIVLYVYQIIVVATVQTVVNFNKQEDIESLVEGVKKIIGRLNDSEMIFLKKQISDSVKELEKKLAVKIDEKLIDKIVG
ncbi:hypothetical protein A3A66_02910 [Microgenomates group bacterium RIFCSPLOWO2_01_FULL_46_13]|nr:MAG: hypothetical protein A2783_05315 [Microgenomates group bacterium RIFCSPHIGHO2_01_FULL_45_11]OGV95123.1 MAG: hypothetical protein A3A66_02910 [Microgenomates group bacterium RIFCSPLOWO2_01_FULL_46_13]